LPSEFKLQFIGGYCYRRFKTADYRCQIFWLRPEFVCRDAMHGVSTIDDWFVLINRDAIHRVSTRALNILSLSIGNCDKKKAVPYSKRPLNLFKIVLNQWWNIFRNLMWWFLWFRWIFARVS
jgi:hypothetical protein